MTLHAIARPLALAGALLLAGHSSAALTSSATTDTLTNLELDIFWDGALGFTPQTLSFIGNNWKVDASLLAFNAGQLAVGSGSWAAQHTTQPHSTDVAALAAFDSFSYVAAPGQAPVTSGFDVTKTSEHAVGHQDLYHFTITTPSPGSGYAHLSAVHAVPEPETYAMLLAGLGVVGLRLRKRAQAN